MRFTLIYQGELPPGPRAKAADKWRIRRELEPQLRSLWATPPLNELRRFHDPAHLPNDCYVGVQKDGVNYVPLISSRLDLRAELQVLLLSNAFPGGLLHSGDIDNRLKTLFDALSIPTEQQAVSGGDLEGDGRLFCLLEDDRLVTRVDVANDRWLAAPSPRHCTAIIRVQPVAFRVTNANLGITG